jgi:diamine N-acetyltransferase
MTNSTDKTNQQNNAQAALDSSPAWPRALSPAHIRAAHPGLLEAAEAALIPADAMPLTRDAKVSLREITAQTVRVVSLLDPGPDRDHLVAPNAFSIAQAHFDSTAWFRAVYADEVPVGFIMLQDPTLQEKTELPKDCMYVWRFMIDQRYQGMGFGAAALGLALAHARSRPGITHAKLSFVPADNNAEAFYTRFGFQRTGEVDDGEIIMVHRFS